MSKAINIISVLAGGYILANWWFTGTRPDDWYIAVMLVLGEANAVLKLVTVEGV